jgi:hypothetical protein
MITIKELQTAINKELKIDHNKLDFDASENPLLIQKYINIFLGESTTINKLQKQYEQLYAEKIVFYRTKYSLIPDTQKELLIFVDGDEEVRELKEKISNQSSLIKFISETISNFRDRGWAIKNMIEFRKFLAGE